MHGMLGVRRHILDFESPSVEKLLTICPPVRGKLPVGGNGAGAPPRGSQANAGALGKGTVIASAMTDAFKFLAYAM